MLLVEFMEFEQDMNDVDYYSEVIVGFDNDVVMVEEVDYILSFSLLIFCGINSSDVFCEIFEVCKVIIYVYVEQIVVIVDLFEDFL